MKRFLITYDLRKPDRDYTSLISAIKEAGSGCASPVESVWIIAVNLNLGMSASSVFVRS